MGRLLLLARLVLGDIKRRRFQSGLLLAMIAATTATLTLALALHGLDNDPFARTRAHPGASLLGSAGSPALTPTTVALAAGLAMAIAISATIAPALRGARTSTIRALNDAARPPQRRPRLIALSSRLGGAGLLAVRLIARRPRRTMLSIVSVTIAVATVIATLIERHAPVLGMRVAGNVLAASRQASLDHVGDVLSAILLIVAVINLVFATWATVLDAQCPTALARALGATPNQVTTGLAGAQVAPALIAVVPATLVAVAALTAIPSRIGAQRPVAEVLRSE